MSTVLQVYINTEPPRCSQKHLLIPELTWSPAHPSLSWSCVCGLMQRLISQHCKDGFKLASHYHAMKYKQAVMSERNCVLSLVVHWCRKYGVREWLQQLSSGKRRQMHEEWRTLNFWRKNKRGGKRLRRQQHRRLHLQREALGYGCMHDVCLLHCMHHNGTYVGRRLSMGGHIQQSVACILLCSYDNRNTFQ